MLETGGLREGGATVEGADPSLVRSFIFLVGLSQASDVVPVLLASLESCLTVCTVMSLPRLQPLLTPNTPTIQSQPELRLGLGQLCQPVEGPVVGGIGQQRVVVLVWEWGE